MFEQRVSHAFGFAFWDHIHLVKRNNNISTGFLGTQLISLLWSLVVREIIFTLPISSSTAFIENCIFQYWSVRADREGAASCQRCQCVLSLIFESAIGNICSDGFRGRFLEDCGIQLSWGKCLNLPWITDLLVFILFLTKKLNLQCSIRYGKYIFNFTLVRRSVISTCKYLEFLW